MTDLTHKRGDSKNYRVTILDSQAVPQPIDLTGAVLRFTIKRRLSDLPSAALVRLATYVSSELLITDALNGQALIQMPSGLTHDIRPGDFCWDLETIRPKELLANLGTVAVDSSGSGIMTFSDAAVPGLSEPGALVDLTAAAVSANQKLVAVIETPESPGSALDANQLRTDYDAFLAEAAIPSFEIDRGNVKTPVGLSGSYAIVADVTL